VHSGAPVSAAIDPRDTADLRRAMILIADDEQANVDLLSDCLRDEGYENVAATTDSSDIVDLCRSLSPDMMRRIGFDHVVDYTQEDSTRSGRHYDLIVDAKTNRSAFAYLRALKPDGVYATVGGLVPRLLQVAVFGKPIQWLTGKQTRVVGLHANRDLALINELFEAGKLNPVIDGPYKLNQLADAFRHFGRAEHQGKVVITIRT
jgi:NADPH:quinone reductase-like Zn-dependent oxidoreductase